MGLWAFDALRGQQPAGTPDTASMLTALSIASHRKLRLADADLDMYWAALNAPFQQPLVIDV